MLSQRDFLRYRSWGVFPEINDHLLKSDEVVPENYYSIPDTCTLDNHDHSFPQPTVPTGYLKHPQFGLPFELSISGFLGNATLAESAGVRLPDSEDSWTWDDWTELERADDGPRDRDVWDVDSGRLCGPVHAADVHQRTEEAV